MSRWLRPSIIGSLLSGGLAFSCLVSNIELVDSLPGTTDGGAGMAGNPPSTDGGDDPGPSGGTDSGGTSNPDGGTSNPDGGTSNPDGGTSNPDGGTSNPGGGSGGVSGSGAGGGYTTDPDDWAFGGKSACETSVPAMMCDDFETESEFAWAGGLPGTRPVITDAPSGEHVWLSSFQSAAMNVTPGAAGFNVSFWVRLAAGGGDHAFIDWSGPGHTRLSFGVEGEAYRFRLASSPTAYSAPELLKHTRSATFDKWTCIELVYEDATFQATVTVLGDAPVKLALVGGTANAGIDQQILELGGADAFDIGPEWTLGETGAEYEFDDVRVVPLGQPSVCQDFITANNP
jgi:hypothetical protein